MRSISKSKLANSNDSEGNQQEDYGCHSGILCCIFHTALGGLACRGDYRNGGIVGSRSYCIDAGIHEACAAFFSIRSVIGSHSDLNGLCAIRDRDIHIAYGKLIGNRCHDGVTVDNLGERLCQHTQSRSVINVVGAGILLTI